MDMSARTAAAELVYAELSATLIKCANEPVYVGPLWGADIAGRHYTVPIAPAIARLRKTFTIEDVSLNCYRLVLPTPEPPATP